MSPSPGFWDIGLAFRRLRGLRLQGLRFRGLGFRVPVPAYTAGGGGFGAERTSTTVLRRRKVGWRH